MFKILCLDGGGSKGYYTAYILKRIEEDFNIKINEYFDLIVGTSTGALISGAIALDVNIDEILKMYTSENDKIFNKRKFKLYGFNSIYKNDYLKKLVKKKYKNGDFKDVKTNLIINATDLTNKSPAIFKSYKKSNISLIDAIIASSSAPIYFEPYEINGNLYTDGCLWANNPSMVALAEVLDNNSFNQKLENIKIMSIGTGKDISPNINEYNGTFSFINWAKDLISLILSSSVKSNEDILDKILGKRHLRLNYNYNESVSINQIPNILIEDIETLYQNQKNQIKDFLELENKDKYNFIQRLIKKIFKI